MAYKIIWSSKAEKTFDIVLEYLNLKWGDKQIKRLLTETERVLHMLSQNPYMFRGSEKEKIHEVLVTKHNLLLYQVNQPQKKVELLGFFDTRKDPKKKPYR